MNVEGREIEAVWWGPRPMEAPTLVLLHEGLGCVALWRDTPEALAEATGCGVFAYSRFGYGSSAPCNLPRPMSYMHDEARHILPRVLDAAGIERCILVGHSDGSSIATIYAGSVQDFRVRGLVLIAPHFFVEDSNLASIAAMRETYETTDLGTRMARYHHDPEATFRGWNNAWLNPRFREFDLTSDLAHIRVPILLVQSEDDPYGTAEQLRVAERETYCPVDTVVVAGAGHAPHIDNPAPARAAIADFVRRVFEVQEPEQAL